MTEDDIQPDMNRDTTPHLDVSKEPQNDLVQDGKSCTEYKIN